MQLFNIIRLKLGGKYYKELARKLGYHRLDKAVERIKSLETTPSTYAWLKKGGGFDMRYSNEEFLIRVCRLLAIGPSSYESRIRAAKKRLVDQAKMREPYVFIDTGFKRRGETIISLAALHQKRLLKFDKEAFLYTPEKEFLEIVSSRIKEHYAQSGGKLDLWGKIQKYIFHDKYGIAHTFDTNGVKISEKYSDLFGYMKRHEKEYDDTLFERDKLKLVSMIFEDARENVLQENPYLGSRVAELCLIPFTIENIQSFLIDAVQRGDKENALFLIDNYFTMIHMVYHDQRIYMQFIPICAYRIECLVDKNQLHKMFRNYLQQIEDENLQEQDVWSQVEFTDTNQTAYEIASRYVDFIRSKLITKLHKHQNGKQGSFCYDTEECRGTVSACNILETLYKERFITKACLMDSLIEFGRLMFQLRYEYGYEHLLARIYKLERDIQTQPRSRSDIRKLIKGI